jgi:hypothetical protein
MGTACPLEEAVLEAGEGTSSLIHTRSHVSVVLAVRVQQRYLAEDSTWVLRPPPTSNIYVRKVSTFTTEGAVVAVRGLRSLVVGGGAYI